jgi:cell division protein FtsL
MARMNFVMLAALVVCAIGLVTSQHRARKLFTELDARQEASRKLDQEWRELQLEIQTLATSKRIEQKAVQSLGMRVPEASRLVTVVIDNAPARPGDGK